MAQALRRFKRRLDANHRDIKFPLQWCQRNAACGVAGQYQRFDALIQQKPHALTGQRQYLIRVPDTVWGVGAVTVIADIFIGQQPTYGLHHAQAAHPAVKQTDRSCGWHRSPLVRSIDPRETAVKRLKTCFVDRGTSP